MSTTIHRLKLHPTSAERAAGLGLCGRRGEASELMADVDCDDCRREWMQRRPAAPDHDDLHAADLAPPPPLRMIDVRGCHELDESGVRIVQRSRLGDDAHAARYTWPSAVVAIASLVAFRTDGQPSRSTSAPSRFERAPIGQSDPSRAVTGLVDRLAAVQTALERAYVEPRRWPESVDESGAPRAAVVLTVEVQRAILRRSVAGTRGFQGQSHAEVADWLERTHGIDLTERQVALVRAAGVRAVAEHLRAIGELEPGEAREEWSGARVMWERRREEAHVGLPGCDVDGWKAISAIVRLSERVCQRLAQRDAADDPLPVYRMHDVAGVSARRAELEAWSLRQARRGAA